MSGRGESGKVEVLGEASGEEGWWLVDAETDGEYSVSVAKPTAC
jgi:hypothetical protein